MPVVPGREQMAVELRDAFSQTMPHHRLHGVGGEFQLLAHQTPRLECGGEGGERGERGREVVNGRRDLTQDDPILRICVSGSMTE